MDKSAPTLTWDSTNRWGCAMCGPSMTEPCVHWKELCITNAAKSAPSKESLERARDYLESSDRGIDCEGVALDGDVEELALEFDAISREVRAENHFSAAIDERLKVTDKLAEALSEFILRDDGVDGIDNGIAMGFQCRNCLGNSRRREEIQHEEDCYYAAAKSALAAYHERTGR